MLPGQRGGPAVGVAPRFGGLLRSWWCLPRWGERLFLFTYWLRSVWTPGTGRGYDPLPVPLAESEAAWFLRRNISRNEVVYRRVANVSKGYHLWAGLSYPWPSAATRHFGFSDRTPARESVLKELPGDAERWKAEGITWFVLAPDDLRLNRYVDVWIGAGRAKKKAVFGDLRIVHLVR